MTSIVVAIDGPGGAGKTSVSRAVARELGLPHLDTGAFYRAATVAVLERDVDPADGAAVTEAVADAQLGYDHGRMLLNGRDVTDEIRSGEVTAAVSAVSAHPAVRHAMVGLQRAWVEERGGQAVIEGRDIGTAVFPDAALKVFLTARPEVRAARRAAQHPTEPDLTAVASDLDRRDTFDATRQTSPLQAADDAIVVDTSELTMEEVVDLILDLVADLPCG